MRLSYSSVQAYETYPAKYRFRYEERLPARPSPARSFGDSLHRALHLFHARPVPVPPTLGELNEMLMAVWVSEGYRDEGEEAAYLAHAHQVLARYHADNTDAYSVPAALEFRFTIDVDGLQLTGTIDRMDRIPGGGYEIIDYKTNRRLPPASSLADDLQLSLYSLAAQQVWGIRPERLTLYFLLPGHRMTTTRAPLDEDRLRRRIGAVAERIAAGRFEPRENRLCSWCDFQPVCPLFRHRFERAHADPAPNISELVDEWIGLRRQSIAISRRLGELSSLLEAHCAEHDYARLFASDGSSVERRAVQSKDPVSPPA